MTPRRAIARAGLRASSLVLALMAMACDRAPEVTVYTSADQQDVAEPVFRRFEAETGIRVRARFDTEATKTTALANALRSERGRPRADVFWSNEQAANVALASEGVTAPVGGEDATLAAAVASWPARWRDPDGRWVAFAGRARVVVHDPERVSDPPMTWAGLCDPRWRGRIAMADPRFGTTRSHFGAMKAYWDEHAAPGTFDAFVDALVANRPMVLTSGNAGVVDAVARGEADVGMTDTDDVFAAQARGVRVVAVYPRHAHDPLHPAGGTFVIPNTVAMVAGAPHPEAARRFISFMLEPSTERQLAEATSRHIALVHSPSEGAAPTDIDPWLGVDPQAVAREADPAVERFMKAMRAAWPDD